MFTFFQNKNPGAGELIADKKLTALLGVINHVQHDANEIKNHETVLVIGATGAGKSTFINYMANRKLELDDTQAEDAVQCTDPIAPIGHGMTSCTDKPQIYLDKSMPFTMIDCPGFFDNRGVDIEVANAIGIQAFAKNAKKVKGIILVVDKATVFAMRGEALENTIKQTLMFLGPNMNQHLDSFYLLISKAAENKVPAILKLLSEEAARLPLCAKLVNSGNVGFYNPLNEFNMTHHAVVDRALILKKINQFKGIPNSDSTFNIALSDSGVLEVTGVLNLLGMKIRNQMAKNDFSKIPELINSVEVINSLNVGNIATESEKLEVMVKDQIKLFEHHDNGKLLLESLQKTLPENYQQVVQQTLRNINVRLEKEQKLDAERKLTESELQKSKEGIKKLGDEQLNLQTQLNQATISQREYAEQNKLLEEKMKKAVNDFANTESKMQSLQAELVTSKNEARQQADQREESFRQQLQEANRAADQRISRLQADLEKTRSEQSQRQAGGVSLMLCRDQFGRVVAVPMFR